MSVALSVILPVYNRVALLPHPLESLRTAGASAPGLAWELIVVDDGSTEDLAAALAPYADLPLRLHRLRENSGLLAARLAGLSLARGDAVCFLDGDDAFAPDKFTRQLAALAGHDVVHGDISRRAIDSQGRPASPLRLDRPARPALSVADFYLSLQPAPHDPIFRRDYLRAALDRAVCPPTRAYDPIAEAWMYYQLSVHPAKIARVSGAFTIVGEPQGERLSRRWERQSAGALRLMEAFLAACPATPETAEARRIVGRCAFATWRALPLAFPPAERFVAVWRRCPPSPAANLGGGLFVKLAAVLGPLTAARLLRLVQRGPYRRCRTIAREELDRLFA